jgi:hypothetical protein
MTVVVGYPYHPLAGQTVLVCRTETITGVCHFRVVTESGKQRLIPQWMCEPLSFDPSPVSTPAIDHAALLDLLRLVSGALSSLDTPEHGSAQEEEIHESVEPVSAAGGAGETAARGRAKRGKPTAGRAADGGDRRDKATKRRRRRA